MMEASKIKAKMREQGITYRELSERSGVSVSTISLMLNHERDVQLSNFKRVCDVLGIDPKEVW